MPKMRWPIIVATVCSISSSDRLSRKHRANRSISPTAWSAAPSNNPPASEVILPPSKAATTERPATRANPNRSALHSVCIGTPPDPETSHCYNTIFSDSEPRCTYPISEIQARYGAGFGVSSRELTLPDTNDLCPRLTAILAADVAGYSRLMGADEEETHER